MDEIWVFIEQDYGEVEESSLGILSKARELGDKYGYLVSGVILGGKARDLAREVGLYGADRVIAVEHPLLETYNSDAYPMVLGELISGDNPNTILFSATRNGRDLAGRIAVKYGVGLLAHVISLDYEDGDLVGRVPGFGGNIVAVVKCVDSRPQLATVTPGVFEARRFDIKPRVEVFEPRIEESQLNILLEDRVKGEFKDISRSEKVVVAGMGTGGRLELAEELARMIGADIGVTRPLADIGVASRDIQIGSTGVSLKARLAIILGASGAPHFVSGIKDCGIVISINKDEAAPIRDYSDYMVIGDIFEVLPRLLERLRG